MSIQTKVIWSNDALTEQVIAVIGAEIAILVEQEKTDGHNEKTLDDPVVGQITNIRNWNSLQTAEEWIIFINALGVPPVSTAILPETTETP
jgi:hypothetical protein